MLISTSTAFPITDAIKHIKRPTTPEMAIYIISMLLNCFINWSINKYYFNEKIIETHNSCISKIWLITFITYRCQKKLLAAPFVGNTPFVISKHRNIMSLYDLSPEIGS